MERIGVVGAGTMGAGIAQIAAQAGLSVILYDVAEASLEAGMARVRSGLDRLVARGKLAPAERDGALARITPTTSLAPFADAQFVMEAAPERLDLKQQLFQELDAICRPDVVLATNTSSLSVTEIGALTGRPAHVVGMHFFNPVPVMKLVEVVRGAATGDHAVALTTALANRLGKVPVQASDTPGFIVNRIARPFPGEALRLYGEQIATVQQIDRIARLAAGFRMGPFELMDLVGMDVNFAVNQSVFAQFFYEPRFRPHPLQARMVQANLLGRKTGRGWYTYEGDQIVDGPAGAQFAGAPGPKVGEQIYVRGDDSLAALAEAAGYLLTEEITAADLVVVGPDAWNEGRWWKPGALLLVDASYAPVTLQAARTGRPEQVVGYGGLLPLVDRQLVEVAPGLRTAPAALERAVAFFRSLGRDTEAVGDSPGLVSARIVACLVNEAAYALMEGVASAADIDTAMTLGVNYPHGPLRWADALGPGRLLRVLKGLHRHTGDDRYRPCPHLQLVVAASINLHYQ